MDECNHNADWEPIAEVNEDGLLTGDTSVICKACGEVLVAPCLCPTTCTPEQRIANRLRASSTRQGLN
jgi:hypothetical protein